MLSVIIASYNTREIILECLKRVKADEVIVVDNASTDMTCESIMKKFPKVKLVRNKKNVGFAKANNQGIENARGDRLLLLNSDCFLEPDTLDRLPDVDVLGCKLLNKDGTLQPSWGCFPTLRRVIQLMVFMDNFPVIRKFIDSIHVRDVSRYDKEVEVDWVTGAFVLLKRQVYETVGGIDENYFMYGEEMEWMYRIKKAGFKVWYSPAGQATHLGRASSNDDSPAIIGEMKGWMYWFKKHNSKLEQILLPVIILSGCLLRIAFKPNQANLYKKAFREIWSATFGQSKR